MPDQGQRYTIDEPARVPWLGLLFGSAAMVPIVAGAVGVWLLGRESEAVVLRLTLIWAAAIVAFLAGVRRGLSFRAPDGETASQLATMLWLFLIAVGGLVFVPHRTATALLLLGYASLAVFDTLAARRGEAPPYFARLRPLQMSVPFLALLAILVRQSLG